jgi:hypothetical protein
MGCGIDQKSTSGTCHLLGPSLECWLACKQSSVAQSTTEAEYVDTASCYSQILWIVQTMRDYVVTYKCVPIMCDSSSAICLAHNPVFQDRAKYIKVRHHFLRDHVEKGEIEMKFIDTERQLADFFTKPLDSSCFASLRGGLAFVIPMTRFEGELLIYFVYLYLFAFLLHLLHTHLSNLASPVILVCICLSLC